MNLLPMGLLAVFVGMLAIFSMSGPPQMPTVDQQRIRISAENFVLYRNAVVDYLVDNPGVRGDLDPDVLRPRRLPMALANDPRWQTHIEPSGLAVIYAQLPPGAIAEVVDVMGDGHAVGINRGGELWSPSLGDLGIAMAMPGYVPEGAVVTLINADP